MGRVQIALGNAQYAEALREALARSGAYGVVCAAGPDPSLEGVLVVDRERLERLPRATARPERVVLIARNAPDCMERAWELGVSSVVYESDPLDTAVLAVMSAGLNPAKTGRRAPDGKD